MKKLIALFSILFSLMSLVSCEEKDSPLLFAEEYVSNPANVKLEYYSPDPCCVSKMYWIKTNNRASKITIKCTNANSIFIENHEGNHSEEYISNEGQWKAEVVNSNTITITFDEFVYSPEDPIYIGGLNVASQTKKGLVGTSISVTRFPEGAYMY